MVAALAVSSMMAAHKDEDAAHPRSGHRGSGEQSPYPRRGSGETAPSVPRRDKRTETVNSTSAAISSAREQKADEGGDGSIGEVWRAVEAEPVPRRTRFQELYLLFEEPDSSHAASFVSQCILFTIVLSIGCFVLATLPVLRDLVLWEVAEVVTTVIFTLELVLRFIVCDALGRPTKLEFMMTPMNILDFVSVLPFYLEAGLQNLRGVKPLRVLRAIRLIRCFRVFKLSKYSAGVNLMVVAMNNSVRPLAVLTFFLCIGVVLFSSLIYFAERSYCPDVKAMIADGRWDAYVEECTDGAGQTRDGTLCCDKYGSAARFDSIATAFWWSIVTMTTVGYGDRTPRTPLGMLVGCLAMLSGIILISLPVAIVGTKFQQAYEQFELEKARNIVAETEARESGAKEAVRRESSLAKLSKVVNMLGAQTAMARRISHRPSSAEASSASADKDAPVDESHAEVSTKRSSMKSARERPKHHHEKVLGPLWSKLKNLEGRPQLNSQAQAQVSLLLELFEHIERVEKQLNGLREKDATLDALIHREFLSLSRAYEAHQKAFEEKHVDQ